VRDDRGELRGHGDEEGFLVLVETAALALLGRLTALSPAIILPALRRTLVALAVLTPLAILSPWMLSAILIGACGIYVAFEFALVKVPLHALERDVAQGIRGAPALLQMKRDMNAMLAACQFGITLTSLGLTLALEPAIHEAEIAATAQEGAAAVPWDVDRLRMLLAMTEMGQGFLKMLMALRMPRTPDGFQGWMGRASQIVARLRGGR
jgi:hypothetical protein